MGKPSTEYGTTTYWTQQIDNDNLQKRILMNALANVLREPIERVEEGFVDTLVEKISHTNGMLKWEREQLYQAFQKEV